ncbi:hypothetical protein BCR34DRAFT_611064 [Clohesyomyces aquaticus]|uniref:Cell wall mannoprotein PIR1-like C-terminal domain-containing protein n=1 Tax=Clohesyomyces aquaticus TaxID=1231657 RepID=A0A1Y2A491_9PLEO|nr:hypothetical protein BCR34DRAFT_611064 [Clohesyomyces aquaticus]
MSHYIPIDSAFQRRRMYESFLEEVPLLSSLTPYEGSNIADDFETKKAPANALDGGRHVPRRMDTGFCSNLRPGVIDVIVANYQFQFDAPPQAGAIYTGGFSVCPNGTLAIGGSRNLYNLRIPDCGLLANFGLESRSKKWYR